MEKQTSLYLDFLRVVAAFGVLFVHANLNFFSNGCFFPAELGHKLVMVFFVLSGFLIGFTVDKKNKGKRRYLVDRFSRLYSVVLPALLFTYLIDFLGQRIHPALYAAEVRPGHQLINFFVNATYLQQIWGFCTTPSSNGPFWSISYEFWYYMLFWVYCYSKGVKRSVSLVILCFITGPKILILFPVWILGVIAYRYSNRNGLSTGLARVVFLITATTVIYLSCRSDVTFFADRFVYGHAPLYFSSQFMFDYIYGLLVAVNIYAFTRSSFQFQPPAFIDRSIKYLSSVTFSLYLFHFPILLFIGFTFGYNKSSYLQMIPILFGVGLFINILATISEKQRIHFKNLFDKLLFTVKE